MFPLPPHGLTILLLSPVCFCVLQTIHTQRAILALSESTSRSAPLSWKAKRWNCKLWVGLPHCSKSWPKRFLSLASPPSGDVNSILTLYYLHTPYLSCLHWTDSPFLILSSGTPQVRYYDTIWRCLDFDASLWCRPGTIPNHYLIVLPWCPRYHCRLRRNWQWFVAPLSFRAALVMIPLPFLHRHLHKRQAMASRNWQICIGRSKQVARR